MVISSKEAKERANTYLRKGNEHQDKNKIDDAITAYQKAIELEPNAAKAYHALGNIAIKQNQLNRAITYFTKAIEIKPSFSTSRYKLAEILLEKGNVDEALANCQMAVKSEPNSWKFQNGLGNVYLKKEQWQAAADVYSKVIELNPSFTQAYGKLKIAEEKLGLKTNTSELDNRSQLILEPKLGKNGSISILFILPVSGGSGGAHSIVQECLALYRCGIEVQIAVNKPKYGKFLATYSDIVEIDRMLVSYESLNEIKNTAKNFSVVCATIYNSVNILKQIVKTNNNFLPAYYIQDYEILFSRRDSSEWREAWDSYDFIPGGILFAKTKWLGEVIGKNHGIKVHKVEPSIDHEVYFPDLSIQSQQIQISMMIRFSTPRRAAKRTLRIAHQLSCLFPDNVSFIMFGSDPNSIKQSGIPLPKNVTILSHITRSEVADVLRSSDIFCDFSDYQAFGRTALEAMACGCVSVVPERGGTNEYAIHNVNSLVVDTTSEEGCITEISKLIDLGQAELYKMKLRAIETATKYSKKRAALSIANLLYNQIIKLQK